MRSRASKRKRRPAEILQWGHDQYGTGSRADCGARAGTVEDGGKLGGGAVARSALFELGVVEGSGAAGLGGAADAGAGAAGVERGRRDRIRRGGDGRGSAAGGAAAAAVGRGAGGGAARGVHGVVRVALRGAARGGLQLLSLDQARGGAGFFAGDAAMLVLAAVAAMWAPRPRGRRAVALIAGAVTVFALVSYGVEAAREAGVKAPAAITVDGRPYAIGRGRFFLFFFNPMCMHCMDAAQRMARLDWGDTRVVAIPVEQPQFARQFLAESGLKAVVSTDFETLARVFGYRTYPFGVAVVDGREKAAVRAFEGDELAKELRAAGMVR